MKQLDCQIGDLLHKLTTGLGSALRRGGVQTLVIGDLRGIGTDNDKGSMFHQKLHLWAYAQTTWQLRYTAERLGLSVVLMDECYTSQTCPSCGSRHKPRGRLYRCGCGLEGHRDVVGAVNIGSKYRGCVPVVGQMAWPVGVRFGPHLHVARGFVLREAAGL